MHDTETHPHTVGFWYVCVNIVCGIKIIGREGIITYTNIPLIHPNMIAFELYVVWRFFCSSSHLMMELASRTFNLSSQRHFGPSRPQTYRSQVHRLDEGTDLEMICIIVSKSKSCQKEGRSWCRGKAKFGNDGPHKQWSEVRTFVDDDE